MSSKLVFKEEAKKEWDKLDSSVRSVFVKKLKERITQPRIESARLCGMNDCYKIKLRNAGYRLVYQVRDKELVVSFIAVGKGVMQDLKIWVNPGSKIRGQVCS